MTVLTCATVQRRLEAFHDEELPIRERIAMQAHVDGCPPCLRELRALEAVRDHMREAAAPGPADDWTGLQPGVISRMRAEAHESWPARLGRMFDDMHLVWIALAATAGTIVCGTVALGLLHYASPERDDSLAAIIATLAAPSGSDLNPMRVDASIQLPTLPEDGLVSTTLEQSGSEGELVLALAAVVTREGRISGLEVLANDRDRRQVSHLLDAISQARLEPARYGNNPIAVNLVWLVEHMTVKGKSHRTPAI